MKISRFTLDKSQKLLAIHTSKGTIFELSFEYLRVFSPQSEDAKSTTLETHKKEVTLITIEAVGKHGYRFIFDDNHIAIYSFYYLETLITKQKQRWQEYLEKIASSGHSREAIIDIKQL